MRAKKGSAFEREICKLLSKWWSKGIEGKARTDIFWRSSQSGGRATQRAKSGLRTAGSYGDIAALDSVGESLLKMFTIELKRGSSYKYPGDLLDMDTTKSKHPWLKCLRQAIQAHERAGSVSWMLICKRDHRLPVVFIDTAAAKAFRVQCEVNLQLSPCQVFRFDGLSFIGIQLEEFLSKIEPEQIISCLKIL